MPYEDVDLTDSLAAWYVPGPLFGTTTLSELFACDLSGLVLMVGEPTRKDGLVDLVELMSHCSRHR